MYDLSSEISLSFFIELFILELSFSFCHIIVFVLDNYSTTLISWFYNNFWMVSQRFDGLIFLFG